MNPCTQGPEFGVTPQHPPHTHAHSMYTHARARTHAPGLGAQRILKTNKQRIDWLRGITALLITSDLSPLLSKCAPPLFFPLRLPVRNPPSHQPLSPAHYLFTMALPEYLVAVLVCCVCVNLAENQAREPHIRLKYRRRK